MEALLATVSIKCPPSRLIGGRPGLVVERSMTILHQKPVQFSHLPIQDFDLRDCFKVPIHCLIDYFWVIAFLI